MFPWVPNSLLEVHPSALEMVKALALKELVRFIVVFCLFVFLVCGYRFVSVSSTDDGLTTIYSTDSAPDSELPPDLDSATSASSFASKARVTKLGLLPNKVAVISSVRELFKIFEVIVILDLTCCHGAASESIFAFCCLSICF